MIKFNPFNPQQPARPDFFVGREPEIIEFEKFLAQTMMGSPMNMSISGNRGIGKTSILIKFEQIARENNCLVVRMSNYESNIKSIMDLCDFICSNIKNEILSKKPIKEKICKANEWLKTFKPEIGWNDVTLSLERKQIAQDIFRTRLTKLWEEVKSEYRSIVLLIDEAESLEKVQGALTFIREVFQRVSENSNYMVVLAGKLNFPERMSESFSPLNRFFPVEKLKHFSEEEVKEYITKKIKEVDVTIDEESISYLYKNSEGHPYVLVGMCFLVFDSLDEKEKFIDINLIKRSEHKIKSKLAIDFFSPMFHPLTKKAKEILLEINENINGTEFSFKEAVDWCNCESNYLSPYILELMRKGIINKPERARYNIFHHLFLDYLKTIENI